MSNPQSNGVYSDTRPHLAYLGLCFFFFFPFIYLTRLFFLYFSFFAFGGIYCACREGGVYLFCLLSFKERKSGWVREVDRIIRKGERCSKLKTFSNNKEKEK